MAWRVAVSLRTLMQQVNAAWPKRAINFDGSIGDANHASKDSDHNPWVKAPGTNMGVVTAIDITHDPANGCDAQKLADAIIRSRDDRVKYIIHNGRMARSYAKPGIPRWTWAPYHGSSAHEHHVHISVQPGPQSYDDPRKWVIS